MFRYEKKYIVTNLQAELLKRRLAPIMDLDSNLCNKDFYSIRSIYFDDYYDTCLNQVINGISERYKYRIRFYDYNDKYIVLEKKYKINNKCKKESCIITRKQVLNILNNKNVSISNDNPKLLNELYLQIKMRGFKPKVIVDYDRIPFVYDLDNIRITIDYNLSCSCDFSKIFNGEKFSFPLLEQGFSILEVKYNSFIPNFIRYALQLNDLERISYSKYGNSRLIIKNYVGGCL